jgi:hypothetical protein
MSYSNSTEQRIRLFQVLDLIIKVSEEKFRKVTASNPDRQKWARVLVSTIECYGKIMTDSQLDDIVSRIEKLEHQT